MPNTQEQIPVSIIILTFNEEANVAACIQSVAWSNDIIVVDSHSTDATANIAQSSSDAVRLYQNAFEDFGQQRNWAIDNTEPKHDWILFVDADERIPDDCASHIQRVLSAPAEPVGYYLTYRNWFMGKWIRHCTLYPSWQLRLFKKGKVRYRKAGHGQEEVTEGELAYIDTPYDHYGFSKGIADWIDRHNDYSSNEAEMIRTMKKEGISPARSSDPVARRRRLKQAAAKVGMRPLLRFLYLYIFRGGFRDGRPGYIFCMLRVAHEIHITAKIYENNYADASNSPENKTG